MERSRIDGPVNFEAPRSDNRVHRMLIAIGTFVGIRERVTWSLSSMNSDAQPKFIYMRHVARAARKSRGAGG